jgi:Ca2+:H+ antiporter
MLGNLPRNTGVTCTVPVHSLAHKLKYLPPWRSSVVLSSSPMPSNDRTPLIGNGNRQRSSRFTQRFTRLFKSRNDEPSWFQSYKFFFFGSWINILLLFVPLSFVSHFLHLDAALRFSFSFIAILPLAKLLGTATDQLSVKLGQTLSGLLNASFGNAVEIIVGVVALLQGPDRL